MARRAAKYQHPDGPPCPPGFRFRPPAWTFRCPVEGTCMEPVLRHGEYVVVDARLTPQEGQVVVAESLDVGLLVKEYRTAGDGPALVSRDGTVRIPLTDRVRIVGVCTHVGRWLDTPAGRRYRAEADPAAVE